MLRAILAALALVLLLSSCGGGSTLMTPADASAGDIFRGASDSSEIMYVSNGSVGSVQGLYTLAIGATDATLTPVPGFDTSWGGGHIAAPPEGDKLYFHRNSGEFGVWDPAVPGTVTQLATHPVGVTMAACDLDGNLYVGNQNTDKLILVDTDDGSYLGEWSVYAGPGETNPVDLSGGDIVFDATGTFYMITNDVGNLGMLYELTAVTDGGGNILYFAAEALWSTRPYTFSGLAVRDNGEGDLVATIQSSGGLLVINHIDYTYAVHSWTGYTHNQGDMSVGQLDEPCEPYTTALIAGQNMTVGTVTIEGVDGHLVVTYTITDPDWCITETHLDVETDPDLIPQKNGNPIPGHFAYSGEHDCVNEVVYTLDPEGDWCEAGTLYIAAHAVVCKFVNGEETTYLAEIANPGLGESRPPTEILKVDWNEGFGGFTLTSVGFLWDFYSSHIAVSADGTTIYGVDNAADNGGPYTAMNGHLCKYDISSNTNTDLGDTGINGFVQLAFNPDGVLYGASQNTNHLYTLDYNTLPFSSANVTDLGLLTKSGGGTLNVSGADLVFDSDGNLYVLTNGSYGLWQVDLTTLVATSLWTWSGTPAYQFTGLAVRFDGTGDFIASSGWHDEFAVFDSSNSYTPTFYDMLNPDGTPYSHYWGDMTSLPAPICVQTETAWGDGEDFPGKNWATYIVWETCCH